MSKWRANVAFLLEVSSRNLLNLNDQLVASVAGCSVSKSVINISWSSFGSDLRNVTRLDSETVLCV